MCIYTDTAMALFLILTSFKRCIYVAIFAGKIVVIFISFYCNFEKGLAYFLNPGVIFSFFILFQITLPP